MKGDRLSRWKRTLKLLQEGAATIDIYGGVRPPNPFGPFPHERFESPGPLGKVDRETLCRCLDGEDRSTSKRGRLPPMKLSWWRSLLIVLLCFPSLLMGWVIGLISLLGFAKSPKPDAEFPFVLTVVWRPWFAKRWKYSTTLGFFMGMHPKTLDQTHERTKKHERVHIRQLIDRGILADILAALAWFVNADLAFAFWVSAPVWQLPNFLGALLRGGHVYRDAEHERSAYAQTDEYDLSEEVPKTWLGEHLSKPRTW